MTSSDAILEHIAPILSAALTSGDPGDDLVTPCRDLLGRGGKRWRPLLLVHCAQLAISPDDVIGSGGVLDTACALTPLVEFAHTASLIHDDIEDASDTRRGAPAIHITYGVDRALNAASWLYFQGLSCLDSLADSTVKLRLYALYAAELRRLHHGQSLDIAWHTTTAFFPSIDDYFTMVTQKTGTLASLAAQVGLIVGGAPEVVVEKAGAHAAKIGVAFQILDDITNLTSGNPGKKRGDDIVEGKKSYPVLLHLQSHQGDAEKIAGHFAEARIDGIDSPAVAACINMLEASGALEKADADARSALSANTAAFTALFPGQDEVTGAITDLFASL
jgi:octaprenyl-diphosphate synthase